MEIIQILPMYPTWLCNSAKVLVPIITIRFKKISKYNLNIYEPLFKSHMDDSFSIQEDIFIEFNIIPSPAEIPFPVRQVKHPSIMNSACLGEQYFPRMWANFGETVGEDYSKTGEEDWNRAEFTGLLVNFPFKVQWANKTRNRI